MAAIKGLSQASDKWSRRASVAGPDYSSGVQNPRTPWAAAAAAGADNWRQGVTAAASGGRFQAGVRKAGDSKWQQAAVAKGPSRFAEGVALAKPDWETGFQPYHAAIGSLALPARGPVGSPANLARVGAVANLLRQVKTRTSGGTA